MTGLSGHTRLRTLVRTTPFCHFWTGRTNSRGHGLFSACLDGRWKDVPARRLLYELELGEIPEGTVLFPACGTRLCIRSSHMEPVRLAEYRPRVRDRARLPKRTTLPVQLNPMELERVVQVGLGKTYLEIAREAGVSPHTVKNQLEAVRKKVGCRTSKAAYRLLVLHGLEAA
jgi:DNA-binding CsgD family transcriptional regulator